MSKRRAFDIVRECDQFTYGTVRGRLAKHYPVLGKGDYATVFQVTKTTAVKVFKRYDMAYNAFIKTAMRMPSEHYPRFEEYELFCQYGYVFMDVLTRFDHKTIYGVESETFIGQMKLYVCDIEPPSNDDMPETLKKALDPVRALTSMFVCDIRKPNLAKRGSQLIILDPLANEFEPSPKKVPIK